VQDDGSTHGAAAGMDRLGETAAPRGSTAGRIGLARLLASSPTRPRSGTGRMRRGPPNST
jgi:hypothetical protein